MSWIMNLAKILCEKSHLITGRLTNNYGKVNIIILSRTSPLKTVNTNLIEKYTYIFFFIFDPYKRNEDQQNEV